MEFTFGKTEYDRALEAAYNANAAKYSVQGFRKGKASRAIIEKNYGDVFSEPAVNELFSGAYFDILTADKDIRPIDRPNVDIKKKDGGVVITATIDVEPKFTLGKYTGLEVKRAEIKVTDKDVDEYLTRVAQSRARQLSAAKDYKIQNGDIAVIDFVGSVNGKEFEGGAAKKHELEIGSHSFIDTFEEQLVGKKIGDKPDVTVTFPKDYHAKELAGAKAVFKVDIRNVLIKELPAIDDTLAKEASEFSTLAEFRADIKTRLEKQAASECAHIDENNLFKTVTD